MAPTAKGKAAKAPAAAAGSSSRGGGGRGQGRKPTSATPNANKAAAADPNDKRKQVDLTALLGARSPAQKRPSVPVADVLKWKADVDGAAVDQKQVKGGLVQYSMDKEEE